MTLDDLLEKAAEALVTTSRHRTRRGRRSVVYVHGLKVAEYLNSWVASQRARRERERIVATMRRAVGDALIRAAQVQPPAVRA